jgi:hypothetical protein
MLGLDNPDKRRALRSIVQAVVALVIVGLVAWIIHLLRTEVEPLYKIALALVGIVFAGTVFYGAENVTRAVKIKAGILEGSIGDDESGTGN